MTVAPFDPVWDHPRLKMLTDTNHPKGMYNQFVHSVKLTIFIEN